MIEDENTASHEDIENRSLNCSEFNTRVAYSRHSRKTAPTSNALVKTD